MIKLKDILNEQKVIKIKFNDNTQTLHFSDGQKAKVDYDGEFKYKGKWFDTSEMEGPEDLEKMLAKAFPGNKFIQIESKVKNNSKSLNETIVKLFEENVPTDKGLWDRAIAAAKEKYDVYPSAYANAFASKWYKEKGGDWKTEEQIKETFTQSIRNLFSELVPKEVYNARTPQEVEKKKTFVRDLVKTLNNFYRQHGIDWKFADTDFKFKMYSKN
jgi:hypothetical protein